MRNVSGIIVSAIWYIATLAAGPAATTAPLPLLPKPDSVDIAPFGEAGKWTQGKQSGVKVEWTERRDVYAVAIEYATEAAVPKPDEPRIEYWFSKWPNEHGGGWRQLDDPWNGQWIAARADVVREGKSLVYRFKPLTKDENPKAEFVDFPFRRTLKVRTVIERDNPPAPAALRVYGNSVWKETKVNVEWGCLAKGQEVWDGAVEVTNGKVASVTPLSAAVKLASPTAWKSTINARPDGIQLGLLYAHNPDRLNNDRGAATIRAKAGSFSFFVDDVLQDKQVFIRGVGAFVSSDGARYADFKAPVTPHWDKTIKDQVAQMPEQTMARAMSQMPAKPPQAVPLGVPGGRQEFFVAPNGNVVMLARSLRTPDKDSQRRGWQFGQIEYRLASGPRPDFDPKTAPSVRRWLEEGCLPMIRTEWTTGGVLYSQASIATMLHGNVGDYLQRSGAEPTVCLSKIQLTNLTSDTREAVLWLDITPRVPFDFSPDGLVLLSKPSDGVERPGLTAVRAQLATGGQGTTSIVTLQRGAVDLLPLPSGAATTEPVRVLRYAVRLGPKQSHAIYWKAPYLELMETQDLARFRAIDFEVESAKALEWWRQMLATGMQVRTPEPLLNDFYRANLWHVLVSTDKDPTTSLYMAPAATVRYDVFPNETCMIVRSLEMRGLHDEAARYLEPFFRYQSTRPLPGNFKSKDGVFFAAGPYTCGSGYNMHHGFVLWAAAEHYKWTHDRKYLEAHLPAILKACNWIITERQATKREVNGRRAPEYGLAPAGQLEDVEEFQYWYATNAYYYKGLKTAAESLKAIGHPEADRIAKEADALKADLLASANEMLARTPAVRLLDGTYAPYLPARLYARTHLTEGWIREALYCALHLYEAGVLEPDDPRVELILMELEDNIFVRPESGFNVTPLDKKWFDWGGFTLQPNLLGNSAAYLERGETRNFLRAFFNTYAASIYPDTACFAEWVRSPGVGSGPLYKTPDECKFVQGMRLMLARERGGELHLASGVPREWYADGKTISLTGAKTFFGDLTFEIRSKVGQGRIDATVVPPKRNPAEKITIRFAHPFDQPMKRVSVNGAEWKEFVPEKGLVILPGTIDKAEVVAEY
jgi:hypothetical protein